MCFVSFSHILGTNLLFSVCLLNWMTLKLNWVRNELVMSSRYQCRYSLLTSIEGEYCGYLWSIIFLFGDSSKCCHLSWKLWCRSSPDASVPLSRCEVCWWQSRREEKKWVVEGMHLFGFFWHFKSLQGLLAHFISCFLWNKPTTVSLISLFIISLVSSVWKLNREWANIQIRLLSTRMHWNC